MNILKVAVITAAIGIVASLSEAKITLKYTTTENWATAAAQGCPATLGGAWHRWGGIQCAREGKIEGQNGCIGNLNELAGSAPFTAACNATPMAEYGVYGKADKLVVPSSGTYIFQLDTDVGVFIFIDGKQLAYRNTNGDANLVMTDYTEEVIGTATGNRKMCETTFSLDAGDHTFDFLYFSSMDLTQSRLILSWKKPGDGSFSVIPASAFGSECTAQTSAIKTSSHAIDNPEPAYVSGSKIRLPVGAAHASVFALNGRCVARIRPADGIVDLSSHSIDKGTYIVCFLVNGTLISATVAMQ